MFYCCLEAGPEQEPVSLALHTPSSLTGDALSRVDDIKETRNFK